MLGAVHGSKINDKFMAHRSKKRDEIGDLKRLDNIYGWPIHYLIGKTKNNYAIDNAITLLNRTGKQ